MDFHKICRICLQHSEQLISLFQTTNVSENNISMLWTFCFGDTILINDGYPENICEDCAVVVVQFYNLKNQYLQSLLQLQTAAYNVNGPKCEDQETQEDIVKVNDSLVNILDSEDFTFVDHDYTERNFEDFFDLAEQEIHRKDDQDNGNSSDGFNLDDTNCGSLETTDIREYLKGIKEQNEPPFKCIWCRQSFLVYRQFYKHIYNHSIKECKFCYNPNNRKPKACNHVTFVCNHCRFITSSKSLFHNHLKSHLQLFCSHLENTDDCSHCLQLLLKINDRENDKEIQCSLCNTLVNHDEIAIHLNDVHALCVHLCNTELCSNCLVLQPNKSIKKPFECCLCGQVYTSNFYLQHHLLKHENTKNYTCQFCGASYLLKQYLMDHMEVHEPGDYTCEICGKRFTRKIKLRRHRYNHFDKRNYKCPICHKAFKQRAHLKTHSVVHTNEKSFACNICGKRFGLKGSLTKHLLHFHKHTTVEV